MSHLKLFLLLFVIAGVLNSGQAKALTARQIVTLIQQHSGVPWNGPTVDGFKAGDPDTQVKKIAVTMMSTFAVLKQASAEGANFIITHEPTFYNGDDKTASFRAANDPVWREKEDFIKEHHLVVWRFHDHWHMRRPDGIVAGMVQELHWGRYQRKERPALFVMPRMTLRQLAKSIKARVGIKVMRVVGNPNLEVTKVAFLPGAAGEQPQLKLLRRNDVQVLVIGEIPEWETIEYVDDAAAQGRPKALILMGHIESEQGGMKYCTEWLKTFLRGVPIVFVPTAEPYWAP